MATKFFAPSMGEGVEELTVINWMKKEGESVKEFELIVELETDKVTTEIPSPATGVLLKILAQTGETVKVGSIMAWIGQPGEKLEFDEPERNLSTPKMEEAFAIEESMDVPKRGSYTGRISPLVKKLVELHSVDLDMVEGTGLHGRITKDDVLNYIERSKKITETVEEPTPPASVAARKTSVEKSDLLAGELVELSSQRKQIAAHMVESVQNSPHVLSVMEADLNKVLAHRAANKEAFAEQGVNLTLTAYFCSAIVEALKRNPNVNASWTDEGIRRYRTINLGFAVALGKQGLIVPVIKNAGMLSLMGLAQKINDLSTRARTKKLHPDEVKDGTFTLTNHGTGGSLFATPIIFQPQAAILGMGMMQKRPVVITDEAGNDAIAIRPMVYLSLVFDHRILDGEGGDRFLMKVKETLEQWK